MSANFRRYPRGYWISVGCAMGVTLGAAIGIILNNVGAGIAIGVAIGSGAGAVVERRNRDRMRPLTDQEKKRQQRGILLGLATLLILAAAIALLMFLTVR